MPERTVLPERVVIPAAVAAATAFFLTLAFFAFQGGQKRVEAPPLVREDGVEIRLGEGRLIYDASGAEETLNRAVAEVLKDNGKGLVRAGREKREIPLKNNGDRRESLLYRPMAHILRWTEYSRRIQVGGGSSGLLRFGDRLRTEVEKSGGRILRVDTTGSSQRQVELRFFLQFPVKARDQEHWLTGQVLTLTQPVTEEEAVSLAGVTVALVMDDWGYQTAAAKRMLTLPIPLTMAVIPGLPGSREQAREGKDKGWTVLLHLPMEPLNPPFVLDPGTIRVGMSRKDILARVAAGLADVPGVSGVNNHMGSRATGDSWVMSVVLGNLRQRGLFFVDSHTSPDSVVPKVAETIGTDFAINDSFLDNVADPAAVKQRLREVVDKAAKERKPLVAIGHARPATTEALFELLPELAARGVRFVPVSAVVANDHS